MPKVELMVRRRRALSLAIGLSVASSSAFAQTDLPSLPELPQLPYSSTAQLPQPYPFASTPPAKSISSRVVGLLGLTSSVNRPLPAPSELSAAPTIQSLPAALPATPATESAVVMAAAMQTTQEATVAFTEPTELDAIAAELPPSQLPELPNERELTQVGSLSDSLIDIEIPLEGSSKPSTPVRSVPTVLVTEAALPELPIASSEPGNSRAPSIFRPDAGRGLNLQKLQPKQESTAAKNAVRSSRGDVELASRVTEASAVGKDSETYSLSDDTSSSFNLSDAVAISTSSNAVAAVPERGISLHLSSSSADSFNSASAREPRGMQVQIEGTSKPPTKLVAQRSKQSSEPIQVTFSGDDASPGRIPSGSRLPSLATRRTPQSSSMESIAPEQMKHGAMLRVGIQDAILVQSDVPIVELSVENPQICQLLQTGSQSYSLLGLQAGSTRIALVSVQANGDRSVEIREVSVAATRATGSSGLDGLAQGITASLEQLFPQYAIDIDVVDRSLLVQGEVDSEVEAKRIISFVRKASLAPVIDRLKSQEQ